MDRLVRKLHDALLAVDRISARRLLLESGLSPLEFIDSVMVPALDRIGQGWERGEVALSQLYMSGRICEGITDDFIPTGALRPSEHPPLAIAVLTDSHLLGKRMVLSVLRAGGYNPIDFGQVSVDELVTRSLQEGIKILLVSTLMLSSALEVSELRRRFDAAGADIKIVAGGAPFRLDPGLWRRVGADASSPTASGVIAIVKELMEGMQWRA